jgi:hypothetical protein
MKIYMQLIWATWIVSRIASAKSHELRSRFECEFSDKMTNGEAQTAENENWCMNADLLIVFCCRLISDRPTTFMEEDEIPKPQPPLISSVSPDQSNRSHFWKYEHALLGGATYSGLERTQTLLASNRHLNALFRTISHILLPSFHERLVRDKISYIEAYEIIEKGALTNVFLPRWSGSG